VRRRAASALLLFAIGTAFACKRPAPPPPAPAQPAPKKEEVNLLDVKVERDLDADNLLNLAYGASVASRTGESNLELSALQAIDGLSNTFWSSPPGGAVQTLTFALAARSRIERLGITSTRDAIPKEVRFETSLDGKRWREALVLKPEVLAEPQLADVKPIEARYVRITTTEPRTHIAVLRSVHALGQELERPAERTFRGCWTVNGLTMHLAQDGARVTGTLATTPPTHIDGGTDGRVARLVWLRAPNRGYATLSMDPATRRLSGLTWYDDISSTYVTASWFGVTCASSESAGDGHAPGQKELSQLLALAGRWSIYGLKFDEREQLVESESRSTLDALAALLRARPTQRFRIASHELRLDAPEQRTAARVAALRAALQKREVDVAKIEFVGTGAKWTYPPIFSAVQRLMASSIDVELNDGASDAPNFSPRP